MSIDVSTEPVGVMTDSGDDDLDHIVCCDPNRALCGVDMTDVEWIEPGTEELECVVCEDLAGSACGRRFCRLRREWRWRRGLR